MYICGHMFMYNKDILDYLSTIYIANHTSSIQCVCMYEYEYTCLCIFNNVGNVMKLMIESYVSFNFAQG